MNAASAQPLYFGRQERPLFGWLHRPSAANSRVGLVICNPFGYEAICGYRGLRYIALAAAERGVATLRFDYEGSGDSAGSDTRSPDLACWQDDIGTAIDLLRSQSGVTSVCLLGLRLGATLAAIASVGRREICGLIAIAPIVSGRAFVREMRALQATAVGSRTDTAAASGASPIEAAGFIVDANLQVELLQADLSKLTLDPSLPILILDRDDLPGAARWRDALENHGNRVGYQSLPGYAGMMRDAHASALPEQMIAASLAWLDALAGTEDARARPAAPQAAAIPRGQNAIFSPAAPFDERASVRESCEHIGPDAQFFAIVSTPLKDTPSLRKPKTIVLLNAGAVHHTGPYRLYVSLARGLAALGHTVVRVDLSGIGDSPARPGCAENVVYAAQAIEDVALIVNFLRSRHPERECHAVGICSGAYHAFKAALTGAALAGITVINPLTFFWKEGMSLDYAEYRIESEFSRYQGSVRSLAAWRKLLHGRVDIGNLVQIMARKLLASAQAAGRGLGRMLRIPLREDLAAELQNIARGGVDMLFVFSERDPGLGMLKRLGGRTVQRLQARGHLDIRVIQGGDHTFTAWGPRTALLSLLAAKFA